MEKVTEQFLFARFYYADERRADGSPMYGDIGGSAAGKFYVELAETASQGPWQQTFVDNVGYKSFERATSL